MHTLRQDCSKTGARETSLGGIFVHVIFCRQQPLRLRASLHTSQIRSPKKAFICHDWLEERQKRSPMKHYMVGNLVEAKPNPLPVQ